MHIKRDDEQNIIAAYKVAQDGTAPIADDDPELKAFLERTGKYAPPYDSLRRKEYPPVGDQLDAIIKQLIALKTAGIITKLEADFQTQVDAIAAVKAKYPKN